MSLGCQLQDGLQPTGIDHRLEPSGRRGGAGQDRRRVVLPHQRRGVGARCRMRLRVLDLHGECATVGEIDAKSAQDPLAAQGAVRRVEIDIPVKAVRGWRTPQAQRQRRRHQPHQCLVVGNAEAQFAQGHGWDGNRLGGALRPRAARLSRRAGSRGGAPARRLVGR